MIPIIAVSAARNSKGNRYRFIGSNKILDNCFTYTILGFIFFCVIITII